MRLCLACPLVVFFASPSVAAAEDAPRIVVVRTGEADIAPVEGIHIGDGVVLEGARLSGSVIRVGDHSASVKLPVDVRVHRNDLVTLSKESGGGIDIAPPRLPGLAISGEFGVYAGLPFFDSFYTTGVQTVFSTEAIYRFVAPVALHATLSHASLAFTSPGNLAAIDASLGPTFDTQYFELGIFLGVMSINDGSYPHAAPGFALEPFLRFGAVDGISLQGAMQLVVVDDAFRPGGGYAELGFPVANRFWGFFRGALSIDGFTRADFGMRALVRGNGDHGSVFMRFSFGGVSTRFEPLHELQVGPGGSVGVEFRP